MLSSSLSRAREEGVGRQGSMYIKKCISVFVCVVVCVRACQ